MTLYARKETRAILLLALIALMVMLSARDVLAADIADQKPLAAQITAQVGHTQSVKGIIYAHSGRFIVTWGGDHKLKLWTSDGRLMRTIVVPGILSGAALSPNDEFIATATLSGVVSLWSTETGQRLKKFPRMKALLTGAIAIAPRLDYLVVCSKSSKDDFCQLYSTEGQVLQKFADPSGTKGSPNDIEISPDGEYIYLAAHKSIYKMHRSGRLVKEIPVTKGFVAAAALSPDGRLLATTEAHNSRRLEKRSAKGPVMTRVWNSDGVKVAEYPSHSTRSISFSTDGQWIVSGGVHDNRVLIHDPGGHHIRTIKIGKYSQQSPAQVALSPDRSQLVTASNEFKPVSMKIWNTDGRLISRYKQSTAGVIALDLDPVRNVIITTSADNQVRYWSLDGRLLRRHSAQDDYPHLLAIAPNGRVVTGGKNITIWNDKGKKLTSLSIHKTDGRALAFTPDARHLITGGADGYVNIIPLYQGSKTRRYVAHDGKAISSLAIHPDSGKFATGSVFNRMKLWDIEGKLLGAYVLPADAKPPFSRIHGMAFTPDGKQLIATSTRKGQEVAIFDLTAKSIRTMAVPNRDSSGSLAISPNGKWLAVSVGKRVGVWDYVTLKFHGALVGHQGGIRAMEFSGDERHLVTASADGSVRVWRVDTGHSFSMLSEKDQWVIYTDDGYFDASRYGGDMVALVRGLNAFAIDQYALYYNRPDIIYHRVGIGEPGFINHFRKYYDQRLAAAKLRDSRADNTIGAPQITILNKQQSGKFMSINFEAEDQGSSIIAVQLYVNDVPIYPGRGKAVSGRMLRLDERIELTFGRNKIEIGAINERGVEALRVPIYAEYRTKVKGDLYFVGMGVSRYKDKSLNLNYAHKDVVDMGDFLGRYQGHFNTIHRLQLTNEKATRAALKPIRRFLKEARADDTIIFLVAGHGGYDLAEAATYYFLPHDVQIGKLPETGVAFADLEALLSGVLPRQKLLFIDTCESGEIAPELLAEIKASADEKGLSIRSRARLVKKEHRHRRPYLLTRDRYIYNSLARRTGAIVFSSSLALESSIESKRMENGVFTEALMHVLSNPKSDSNHDGFISVSELETGVKIWVSLATGNLQHPNIERDNIYLDFKLPVARP